jgi:hypothetical protein
VARTLVLACLLALTFACLPQTAGAQSAHTPRTAAATHADAAKKHKRKPKHSKPKPAAHCKLGQARVQAGKRTFCVHNALPVAHSTPQAATAITALHLGIGKTRDRRGRRSKSLSQLLGRVGPHAYADLEKAVSIGISKGERLQLGNAQAARAATIGRSAESGSGCGPGVNYVGGSSKVDEANVSLDIENGALKLGIDLKGKGIDVSVKLRSCGDGAINVDSCPTAEGKVEGHGQAELEASFKVSEGSTVVMAQAFKFSGETTIKAQTGDDGKLDYYDIKHIYTMVGSFGGSKAKFGPLTVNTTYIGEAHIDMHSGGAPPPAQVDVMVSMAGADPAERIAAEIKVAHEMQAGADKEFAAEVEKATKQLKAQEGFWLTPNKCASVQFEPASETLTLTKRQTGTVKSRTEAKGGGTPQKATWTLSAQQNATFTPGGSEGNPLSTSYNVTNAGKGLIVSATFKATSKAGVAEATWKQKTAQLLKTISGTFTGRIENQGSLIQWTGTATFERVEIGGDPEAASTFRLSSGQAEVTASGFYVGAECKQSGKTEVGLQALAALWTVEREGESFNYQFNAPFDPTAMVPVTLSSCNPINGLEGTETQLALHATALQSGEVRVSGSTPETGKVKISINQISPDGLAFEGSASEESGGEKYSWSWSFKGST